MENILDRTVEFFRAAETELFGPKPVNPVSNPIPEGCDEHFVCSKEWISSVFKRNCTEYEYKGAVKGGYSGPSMHKLEVTFDDGEKLKLVAKYCAANHVARDTFERIIQCFIPVMLVENMCRKEIYFYDKIQPILATTKVHSVPLCYYVGLDDCENINGFLRIFDVRSNLKMVIILEDLSEQFHMPLKEENSNVPTELSCLSAARYEK
jgi:hypothetical protein